MFMPCMYVKTLFDLVGLRGVGVLTCMTNPEARDIWSLPYVRIMVPTCHNSDVFGLRVWALSTSC